MKTNLFFFLFCLIIYSQAISQTIKITNVSEKELCIGYSYTLDFEAQGNFNNENVFVAQISLNNFNTFQLVGSLKSTTSGSINIKIPKPNEGLYIEGKYKIRVISSNPYVISSVYGEELLVLAPPSGNYGIVERSPLWVVNKKIRFRLEDNTSKYFKDAIWNFGEGADIETSQGITAPIIQYSTTGVKNIVCSLKSPINCANEAVVEKSLTVYDCSISLDPDAYVDSTTKTIEYSKDLKDKYKQVWILPGGSLNIKETVLNTTFLIETGGQLTLLNSGRNCLFYLKPGASMSSSSAPIRSLFLLTPGSGYSGMPDSNYSTYGECSQLNVNYQSAPIEGIRIMEKLGYLNIADNLSEKTNFQIFPNPAEDYIEITCINSQNNLPQQEIKIYNTLGECVIIETLHAASLQKIDISGLLKGVYFVKLGERFVTFLKI